MITDLGQLSGSVGASPPASLEVRQVSKTFGDRRVLDVANLSVRRGTVHALLGGNGSGKSTFVKALAGVQPADAHGSIAVNGVEVDGGSMNPSLARRLGLRFVHQDPGFFPTLTVAENIALAHGLPTRAGVVRRGQMRRTASEALQRVGLDIPVSTVMGSLSLVQQTMVAIARALLPGEGHDAGVISVLVLDEPTATLTDDEVRVLHDAVRRMAATGVSIVYISHRLDEVLEIADEITVLRDGRAVLTCGATGMTEDELIAAIVGRPLADVFPPSTGAPSGGEIVLKVRHLEGGKLRGVDLTLHAGEILGIAGLVGSGRTELLQAIFGSYPGVSGTIRVGSDDRRPTCPADAMRSGVAFVPENRRVEAAFPDLSVLKNLSTARLSEFSRFGIVDSGRERADAIESVQRYRIRARDVDTLMSTLSGGNQQKAVVARWLQRQPRILLLDEPTQGVDVGARADIYQLVRAAVATGMAVILVSSDFEELAEMADRAVVLSGGRVVAEIPGHALDRHTLTQSVLSSREVLA